MKCKILLTIVAITMIFLSCGKDETVRYDGLYQASSSGDYWYYLSFYEDGVVVKAST